MRFLANSIYMTDKLHFVVKIAPRVCILLERFTQLSPTTNVNVFNCGSKHNKFCFILIQLQEVLRHPQSYFLDTCLDASDVICL